MKDKKFLKKQGEKVKAARSNVCLSFYVMIKCKIVEKKIQDLVTIGFYETCLSTILF